MLVGCLHVEWPGMELWPETEPFDEMHAELLDQVCAECAPTKHTYKRQDEEAMTEYVLSQAAIGEAIVTGCPKGCKFSCFPKIGGNILEIRTMYRCSSCCCACCADVAAAVSAAIRQPPHDWP